MSMANVEVQRVLYEVHMDTVFHFRKLLEKAISLQPSFKLNWIKIYIVWIEVHMIIVFPYFLISGHLFSTPSNSNYQ